jgi:localization factor PodJL
MKPGVPWSVKGIEPDVREAAKVAARRSGMTLGEWLNSKILETAEDEGNAPSETYSRKSAAPSHALERTASKLEDIAEHLSRLSRRESETSARSASSDTQSFDHEVLQKVLGRVESNERQTVEAFTAVNDRLSVLGRQFAQATKVQQSKPEEHPGYLSLEKAVRNIVEHMETSEKRTRDNFKSLHERMAALSQKAAAAPQDAVSRQSPAFTQLETRLAELAKRVEQSEANPPAQTTLPDLLKNELTELANRIDTVRDTAEQLASRAQTQAVQTSQQELRAIEARIVGLIKEAQASLTGSGAGPAEMQRMRNEVERLNARIDEAAQTQAQDAQSKDGDVNALRVAVEQLSTRVAQGPDMRPLAEMDQRILDITQQLEITQAQSRNLPQVNELERRMAELDHKLNEAVSGRSSAAADEIENRLSEIASRVERTEQQLGSLETIERAVNQLFDSMEQQRNWTQEVADNAANRVAQQFASSMPAAQQPLNLTDAPEIQALQNGIEAVRMATENAEGRNQETLEAVHETLEQIVTKLAELETAAIGQRVAAAAHPVPKDAAALGFVEPPAENWDTAPAVTTGNPFETAAPFAEPVQSSEPAFQTPGQNPFEETLQPLAPSSIAQAPVDGDDFIAAARRAAQASAQPRSMLAGLSPGAARASEDASKKLLNIGFLNRKAKASVAVDGVVPSLTGELKAPPGFKAAGNDNTGKRRKYIIMGIFLLAAVSAFTFTMLGQAKKAMMPVEPLSIEEQLKATPSAEPAAAEPSAVKPANPEGSVAKPPKPKPAQIEGMLMPDGADEVLTGSVAQPAEDLASIVSGQDDNMPPSEAGSLQLREAAAMGNVDAQFVIATRYLNGEAGVKQDHAKAAYWYGKAASAGSAPAQYRLGTLYERGVGVAKDLKGALGWYERSASLGNVKAMHNAAVLAAGGAADKPDYSRAFKWFSLGAAHGLKDSQFNLAVLLERGLGTKANAKEALFWYSMAAKQNDADADKRAATIAKTLSKASLEETEKRLRIWKPETAPDAANTVAITDPKWQASAPDAG